jgi:kanamycin kinase
MIGSEGTAPVAVIAAADGAELELVWVNETGGRTFRAGAGGNTRFIKWAPAGSGIDLAAEVDRLSWAWPFHPVPRVLDHGRDADGSWLVTAALPGESAVSPRWKADPAVAVAAIGEGLRALHDTLPVADCPFSWSAADRLADARRQAARARGRGQQVAGARFSPANWHPCHQGLTVSAALAQAADIPPPDKLVVCHGDACAPNTLVGGDGRWAGHVDLGLLGVADRWADLAVATWSAEWNYGPGWEHRLLDAYGVRPDSRRTRYYRLLWDLSS